MKKTLFVMTVIALFIALMTPTFAFQKTGRFGSKNSFGPMKNRVALQDNSAMASVYVVHGIPGQDLGLDPALPVDVLVNDSICALDGFTFGEVAGPLSLDPGTYNIKIGLSDPDSPCSNAPVIEADVPLEAGKSYTIIAHLTESGDPTASLFENNLSRTMRGKARLIVHHTAAAPAVDITVQRGDSLNAPAIKVENFANGDQVSAEIRPGDWNVSIFPAGTFTPVFGPVTVTLKPFTAYLIYAVGSVSSDSFTLIVKPIYGLK